MLPKAKRVRKTTEYDRIFKDGRSIKTRYFSIVVSRVEGMTDGPKFGFIASKKVGGAVERNKAKRLLREVIKENMEKIPGNVKAAVIAYNSIEKASLEDLRKEFERILPQLI